MDCDVFVQDQWTTQQWPDPHQFGLTLAQMPWQQWFQDWLALLQPTLSPIAAYELSLRFTNDAEIQDLNGQYRQQPKPTDVLSFAALEDVMLPTADLWEQEPLYLGDIVISLETAARQAPGHGYAWHQEAVWLATHGLLHLLGWDHPDDASLEQMLTQQTLLLTSIGEPLPCFAE